MGVDSGGHTCMGPYGKYAGDSAPVRIHLRTQKKDFTLVIYPRHYHELLQFNQCYPIRYSSRDVTEWFL